MDLKIILTVFSIGSKVNYYILQIAKFSKTLILQNRKKYWVQTGKHFICFKN